MHQFPPHGITPSSTDGDVLKTVAGKTAWGAPTAGGGATTLDALTDVDTTTTAPAVGDLLRWDGTKWAPHVPPIILLAAAAAVPAGTPAKTIIVREA